MLSPHRNGCRYHHVSGFLLLGIICGTIGSTRTVEAAPTDPDFALQWGLVNTGQLIAGQAGLPGAHADVLGAWAIHTGSPPVIVAIVGPGVDAHPEFADRLLPGLAFISDPFDTSDTRGEGTHVAGIIAAAHDNGLGIAGINPNALLLPVRVTDGTLSREAIAAEGVIWAVDKGADVIVVLRTYHNGSKPLADAITYAADHDVVVVAPVGDEENPQILFPAAFEGCIAVSGTTNLDEFAPISNWGLGIEISAPGQNIWSTAREPNDYEYRSGSTIAAGFVAGVASLIRSYAPQLSAVEVKQILIDTVDDLGQPGPDDRFGAGRLNAASALAVAAAPALRFELLDPVPRFLPPDENTSLRIRIASVAEQLIPGSGTLLFRVSGNSFSELPLSLVAGDEFEATIPPTFCGSLIDFYFRAQGDGGTFVTHPIGAPADWFQAEAVLPRTVFHDDFDADMGWTTEVQGKETVGAWVRDVPVGTSVQPGFDAAPGVNGACYLTGQYFGGTDAQSDLDGGPVILTSPLIELPDADARVSYMVWLRSDNGIPDFLTVEASTDDGASWHVVDVIEPGVTWEQHGFQRSDVPSLNGGSLQVRFVIADEPNDSVTEAAVDEFRVTALQCDTLRGDANGDGAVNLLDWAQVASCLAGPGVATGGQPCDPSDLNRDNRVDLRDAAVLQDWFGVD